MRIVSFNINGLRARPHQLEALKEKYDPDIGIYGMDINVVLERPGHRVSRRRKGKAKVGKGHGVSREESMKWFSETFGIKIMEE